MSHRHTLSVRILTEPVIDFNGVFITGPCLSWEQTKSLLFELPNEVTA
jgi:3-deoxy-D-arabino-heptulosonate 7-phosphate (DAHP) synthase